MKNKIYLLPVLVLSLCLCACVATSRKYGLGNSSRFNRQQTEFIGFLQYNDSVFHSKKNKIQKKEFLQEYEKTLYEYLDSVKLFVNWEGVISDINATEAGKGSTALEFKITCEYDLHDITFDCIYVLPDDSVSNDSLYNKVKEISDNSTVYFDGLIRTMNNERVKYSQSAIFDDDNIQSPCYSFFVTDVGEEKRSDSLSVNLQKAVDCSYKITEPLRLQYLKKITKAEQQRRWNEMAPSFDAATARLDSDEKAYLARLNKALTLMFLWGD